MRRTYGCGHVCLRSGRRRRCWMRWMGVGVRSSQESGRIRRRIRETRCAPGHWPAGARQPARTSCLTRCLRPFGSLSFRRSRLFHRSPRKFRYMAARYFLRTETKTGQSVSWPGIFWGNTGILASNRRNKSASYVGKADAGVFFPGFAVQPWTSRADFGGPRVSVHPVGSKKAVEFRSTASSRDWMSLSGSFL